MRHTILSLSLAACIPLGMAQAQLGGFTFSGQSTASLNQLQSDLTDDRSASAFDMDLRAQRTYPLFGYANVSIDLNLEITHENSLMLIDDQDLRLTYENEFILGLFDTHESQGVSFQEKLGAENSFILSHEVFDTETEAEKERIETVLRINSLPSVNQRFGIRSLYFITSSANRAYSPLPSLSYSLTGAPRRFAQVYASPVFGVGFGTGSTSTAAAAGGLDYNDDFANQSDTLEDENANRKGIKSEITGIEFASNGFFSSHIQFGQSDAGDEELGTQFNFLDLAKISYYLSTDSENVSTYAWTAEFSPLNFGTVFNLGYAVNDFQKHEAYQFSLYHDFGLISVLTDVSDTPVFDKDVVNSQDQKNRAGFEVSVETIANNFLIGYSQETLFSEDTGEELRIENRHDFAPNVYWEISYIYSQQTLTSAGVITTPITQRLQADLSYSF